MKILTVVGARPQFVKAAVLSRKIKELTDWKEMIVHTGQHFDSNMSEVFFREMNIPKPDYQLNINKLSHGAMTGRMLEGIEKIILQQNPDLVLVYGDTNSTLAGALAAKKAGVKLAHVEAGLRSYNLRMPEEVNRILTDRISDILFCPAQKAIDNLIQEGADIYENSIHDVGDIMYDAVLYYQKMLKEKSHIFNRISKGSYILLTMHRQENTDNPERLKLLVKTINALGEKERIIFPIHPRTHEKLKTKGLELKVEMIDPVGYFDMLALIKNSKLVMTDSGGLQKEAFYLEKHCITLRDETEWTELVDLGVNAVCGAYPDFILNAYKKFTSVPFKNSVSPYGGGDTGERIIEVLVNNFHKIT